MENKTNPIQPNLDSADALKFVMSIVVVAIHSGLGGDWHLSPIYPFARLAVPVFFMLSSYFFFSRYLLEDEEGKKLRLRKFLIRNAQLYAFWCFVLFIPTGVVRGWFSKDVLSGVADIFHGLLFGSTFISSWFISSTVIAVLIVVKCSKWLSDKTILFLAICCYLIACLSSNYAALFSSCASTTASTRSPRWAIAPTRSTTARSIT